VSSSWLQARVENGVVIGDVFLNKNEPDTGIKKSLPVVWKGFFFI